MADVLQLFSTADNVTAVAVASFVLYRAARELYKRTLGSRRVTAQAIRSLTPGNPIAHVEALFGHHLYSHHYELPAFEYEGERKEFQIEQRLYNARHGWLTVHFEAGKICAFAFMLTDKRFNFEVGPTCRGVASGLLGRTTFAEISPERPSIYSMFTGAYNWGYSETHYYGRPGNYQHYAFSSTMFGWANKREGPDGIYSFESGEYAEMTSQSEEINGVLDVYRKANAPDTVAVFGAGYGASDPRPSSGTYDQDDLRNLEGEGPKGWRSRSQYNRGCWRNRTARMMQWVHRRMWSSRY